MPSEKKGAEHQPGAQLASRCRRSRTIVGINGSVVNGTPLFRPSPMDSPGVRPVAQGGFRGRPPDPRPPRLANGGLRLAPAGGPRPGSSDHTVRSGRRSPGPVATGERRRTRRPRRPHLGGEPQGAGGSVRSPHPPRAAPATGVVPRSADTPARRRQTGVASSTPTAAPREGPPALRPPRARNPVARLGGGHPPAAPPRLAKNPLGWSGTVEHA